MLPCICTYMYTHTYTHVHTYICTHTHHTYAHTYISKHTHINTSNSLKSGPQRYQDLIPGTCYLTWEKGQQN